MENTDVNRTNGHHGQRLGQHAYEEMRRAVTETVEQASEAVKTLEKRLEKRPYLAAGVSLGITAVALGAGALFVWLPRRRRGLAQTIERLAADVLETTLRRIKTAI